MLDENARLIAAIVENQNLGKLNECIEYQKKLQDNLMTLASLADAQATPQQQAQPNPGQPQPGR
ncbi:GRF1-interacting factor 3-like isoform X2 [Chlorella sorokiniana]|uniref:GRF1-interacting factor 3-like isoform X2 n=1 Tax=Chlorella sorokiniana TaxID=3076 RepID=A0A2P6U0Z0_CHLSO|nr:GRF1-interacting factor 3-like isoform X2 [Chlorella sorokiniana]|eukprot:PRW59979.1 GRF1-interacting factor 3-like isoform X2 [Chlorella sorokiniana]